MTKPRVLIVGAFPPPNRKIFGGIITSCQSLLDSSFATQFDLILVDSTQISNPPPGAFVRGLLALRRLLVFMGKLFIGRPQAVLLFTATGASAVEKGVMAWIARVMRIPVFIFPRGAGLIDDVARSSAHRRLVSAAMRGATHFLCQGPVWQRFAVDVLGFPLHRAQIVPNWTATNRLLRIGRDRVAVTDSHIPQFLFLGWLEREKGIFELLDVVKVLAGSYSFKLVIAGRGHAEEEAKAYVNKHGLTKVVDFVGWVQGEELERLLAASDVLVLPSWAEGLPNAMIEAMAAKLTVVVSSVGNVPDVITDGQEALLIAPTNVQSLKQAIERLLIDVPLRNALAERGHAFASCNFAVEPAVEKLSNVIQVAIQERTRLRNS